jgi:hypothetical protein
LRPKHQLVERTDVDHSLHQNPDLVVHDPHYLRSWSCFLKRMGLTPALITLAIESGALIAYLYATDAAFFAQRSSSSLSF